MANNTDNTKYVAGIGSDVIAIDDAAPRTFSQLKLYVALATRGLWNSLKSWLEAQNLNGVNAYVAFDKAKELREDHPLFQQWFTAAKSALGISDAEAEAILDESETTA